MSKVKWLIESDLFENNELLFNALKKQDIEYKEIPSNLYYEGKVYPEKETYDYLYSPEDCVVFVGSLQFGKKFRKTTRWIPGVYYNIEAFNCTNYYAALGNYLLNDNYIMLPYGELIRRKEYLYDHLGSDRAIFIRPNRGDKLFTGKVVYKEKYEDDINFFNFYNVDPHEIVVVAEPKNLVAEWRFIVVENRVITGSLYKETFVGSKATYPQEAFNLANEIATKYNPDIVWVIDICLTKSGEYRLMEVGCFSCAGLYLCDRDIIVEEVSKAALKEWESYTL